MEVTDVQLFPLMMIGFVWKYLNYNFFDTFLYYLLPINVDYMGRTILHIYYLDLTKNEMQ